MTVAISLLALAVFVALIAWAFKRNIWAGVALLLGLPIMSALVSLLQRSCS